VVVNREERDVKMNRRTIEQDRIGDERMEESMDLDWMKVWKGCCVVL
jgi:hypothetical protein